MAKTDKKTLGKGIKALLENADVGSTQKKDLHLGGSGIREIDLAAVEINPFQPRNDFQPEALQDLADSIQTFGVIQPITVRRLDGRTFQLISGERRLRASKLAGLSRIPAFVREANDQEMLEMALVENIQRSDLNAIEVAISYQRLIDECNLTHEELSGRIGKKRSTVTNYIRLLKLPPIVQQALKADRISMGHARSLISLTSEAAQIEVLDAVLRQDLSVRATEKLVQSYSKEQSTAKAKPAETLSPAYQQVVDHLSSVLGTKVKLNRKRTGSGNLTIPFASDEDLNRILDLLEGN